MMLLAVGGIVGAYFAMPEKLGPLLKKFGVPMDQLLAQTPVGDSAPQERSLQNLKPLKRSHWTPNLFKLSENLEFEFSPLENEKGLQVIAPADPLWRMMN